MPNKPRSTYFSEFRNFAEWQRRGKVRIKREHLPGIGAWLLMLANRYEKAAEAMEAKVIKETVPGMREAAQRMRFAVEHISWVINQLPQNYAWDDWKEAVVEICQVLNIKPGDGPLYDVGDEVFATVIEVPGDGSEQSGTRDDVQPSRSDDPKPAKRGRRRARDRR